MTPDFIVRRNARRVAMWPIEQLGEMPSDAQVRSAVRAVDRVLASYGYKRLGPVRMDATTVSCQCMPKGQAMTDPTDNTRETGK